MAGVPGAKRRRYSLEPDLEIEVEGEVFHVHSFPVMTASRVFCAMLEGDMKEALEGRIALPMKSREEFQQVLPFISWPTLEPEVAAESVHVLLRWADEYEIESLRRACERHLLDQPADSVEALQIAVDFRLAERIAQCAQAISEDIGRHMQELARFGDDPAVMGALWPALFKAAGLIVPEEPLPPTPSVRQLWPLLQTAVAHGPATPGVSASPSAGQVEAQRVPPEPARLPHPFAEPPWAGEPAAEVATPTFQRYGTGGGLRGPIVDVGVGIRERMRLWYRSWRMQLFEFAAMACEFAHHLSA